MYPQARHDGVAWEDSKFPGDKKRALRARNRERWCFGAACCQKRGDWSWMKQALGMVGWRETSGKGRCCWKCLADRKDNPYTDGCLNACWRSTKLSTLEYLTQAIADKEYVSTIFEWPGFILEFVHADFMHCVCLGVAQFVLGNILWELFLKVNGVQCSPDEAVSYLWVCIRLACKQLRMSIPVTNLTFGMFKREQKAPKFMAKAAETRNMVPVVLKILELFFPPDHELEVVRFNCLEALNLVYEQLKTWNAASPHIISCNMRRHVALYGELSADWLLKNVQRTWIGWKFYPKHHLSIHCCEDQVATHGNPAASWAYRDESEIGDCVKVAESGVHPNTLSQTLMERMRVADTNLEY